MPSFLSTAVVLLQLVVINQQAAAFQISNPVSQTARALSKPTGTSTTLFSTKASSSSSLTIRPFGEDEASINKASEFMLQSFWIPLSLEEGKSEDDVNTKPLLQSIKEEFTARYGEIMGRRTLKSCLLSAYDISSEEEKLVGIVGIDMTLIDTENQIQYSRNEAESTIKKVVSSLGPKQRREYKDSTVAEIVNDLLPPHFSVGAVLSNLAVGLDQRKRGIGLELCNFVEEFVVGGDQDGESRDSWCVDDIYLRVEEDNTPARNLYEQKMGYECAWVEDNAVALRADLKTGEFEEIEKTTLSLRKKLS